jgi:hypothetical protein
VLRAGLPSATGEAQGLALLWAAKEAVRKMAWPPPLPPFAGIRLIAAEERGAGETLFSLVVARPGAKAEGERLRVLALLEMEMAWALGCRPDKNKR